MTEPDVTLTDYALMILCTTFAWRLARLHFGVPLLQRLWLTFFSSVALASATGGTVHGFFLDETTLGYQILWPVTLLAIGITASSAWILAGLFVFGARAFKGLAVFAAACFLIYSTVVLFYSQSFLVVILNYMPPMIALLFAAGFGVWRTRSRPFSWIAIGIGISFLAAFIQQAHLGLHPQYFNHNSTYHLVQGFGLYAMFLGAKGSADSARLTQ